MDHTSLNKIILAVLLVFWVWLFLKKRKKQQTINPDPAIAEANARERYNWRYLRWCFRAVQFVCVAWIVWTYLKAIVC